MAVELASAYVSLSVSTDKIPKQIDSALNGAGSSRAAERAGTTIGDRLSGAMGTAVKAGAATAGVAAAGFIGTALTKGFGRLTAIDDAQGKLTALGHTTQGISTIMESALASVKGTSYGLGEAATIAASAVAAGIKPGEELTKYLSLTADAATIAGSSIEEMGLLFNQAQTKGKVYTLQLNQLASRGIPIYQWLADELSLSQEALSDMVSSGKLDSETYFKAIEANIGGAATAATTVSSQWANTQAAMGRLGAAALEPTFNRLAGWLGSGIEGIDGMTDAVKPLAAALDQKVFEEWGPKLADGMAEFRKSDFAVDTAGKLVTLFQSLESAASASLGPIKGIGASLAEASAKAGAVGFGSLVDVLNGLVPIVAGVLVPSLELMSSVLESQTTLVAGLAAAYMAFRAVSFLAATKSMQGLQATTMGAATAFRNFGRGVSDTRTMFAQTGNQVSRLGASIAYLSTGQNNVGKLASSFRSASDGAKRFGTAAGVAAAAGTGLRTAAGGLMSAMGGPFGLAIAGATVGLIALGQAQAKTAERNREIKATAEDLGKALYATNGTLTAQGQMAAATALENLKLAGSGRSLIQYLESVGVSGNTAAQGLAGSRSEMKATLEVLEEQARLEAEVNAQRVGNGEGGFGSSALGQLFNFGGAKDRVNEAQNALNDFKRLDAEARSLADSQRRLSISSGALTESGFSSEFGVMSSAMAEFAASTGTAADKAGILNSALSSLRGEELSLEDANQRVNDSLRAFGEAAGAAGGSAINTAGQIDTTTDAGSRLYSAMKNVQTAFDEAGSAAYTNALKSGESQDDAAAAAEAAGQRVRDEFIAQQATILGSHEAAVALANQYGLFPDTIPTRIELSGEQDADRRLELLAQKERIAKIRVMIAPDSDVHSIDAWATAFGGTVTRRAEGGPIFGAGGPTSDSIPAMLSAGEHVLTASEVDAAGGQGAVYKMRQAIRAGALRFNEGGAVGSGIQKALQAGRGVTGNKYGWGGTGPTNFDCSGFVGWLQQIAMGLSAAAAAGKRLYTTHDFFGAGSSGYAGLLPGLGPSGTQFQVGVNQEHMAATVGGQPAESGGAHGASRIGAPAVGATDSQFTRWFHLPNSAVAGGVSSAGRSRRGSDEERPEWTESDELDLQDAHLAIQDAKDARAKLDAADSKATSTDRDRAEISIRRAEIKALELQQKKDEVAEWVPEGPAPQAPAMAEAWEKEERDRLRAQIAVDEANDKRNEVYADPFASDNEKLAADMDLQDAQDNLDELLTGKKDKSSREKLDYSLRGSLTRFGNRLVDAAVGGLFGQLPSEIADSRWIATDWNSLIPDEMDGEGSGWFHNPDDPIGNLPTPSKDKVDRQLPVTPGAPGWVEGLLKVDDFAEKIPAGELEKLRKRAPKVYDNGGWLNPGETAINLGDRPEPIFNSPDQLRRFAGQLEPANEVQPIVHNINFNRDVSVQDMEGFKRELRWEQNRQSAAYRRR